MRKDTTASFANSVREVHDLIVISKVRSVLRYETVQKSRENVRVIFLFIVLHCAQTRASTVSARAFAC